MVAGFLKILLHLTLWQCIRGRIPLMPKFYGQDSAIIVDPDKIKLSTKLKNELYYNIPTFKLNPGQPNPTQITFTKTASPRVTGEYPSDLLNIARTKLGFTRTDQLPSINELGNLLGTSSDDETINYVRALTSTEQGLFLMKTYLKSIDFETTDSNAGSENKPKANDESDNNTDFDIDYDTTTSRRNVHKITKISKPQQEADGSLKSVNDFINQYGLWLGLYRSTKPRQLLYKQVLVAPVQPKNDQQHTQAPASYPLLVRHPSPYHYPIPLRPVLLPTPVKATPKPASVTNQTNSTKFASDLKPTHLNPPKETSDHVAPHIQELARIANIPPGTLYSFFQEQPKLAELAKRVSRLPLVQQHNKAIDSQLILAVKRALTQVI